MQILASVKNSIILIDIPSNKKSISISNLKENIVSESLKLNLDLVVNDILLFVENQIQDLTLLLTQQFLDEYLLNCESNSTLNLKVMNPIDFVSQIDQATLQLISNASPPPKIRIENSNFKQQPVIPPSNNIQNSEKNRSREVEPEVMNNRTLDSFQIIQSFDKVEAEISGSKISTTAHTSEIHNPSSIPQSLEGDIPFELPAFNNNNDLSISMISPSDDLEFKSFSDPSMMIVAGSLPDGNTEAENLEWILGKNDVSQIVEENPNIAQKQPQVQYSMKKQNTASKVKKTSNLKGYIFSKNIKVFFDLLTDDPDNYCIQNSQVKIKMKIKNTGSIVFDEDFFLQKLAGNCRELEIKPLPKIKPGKEKVIYFNLNFDKEIRNGTLLFVMAYREAGQNRYFGPILKMNYKSSDDIMPICKIWDCKAASMMKTSLRITNDIMPDKEIMKIRSFLSGLNHKKIANQRIPKKYYECFKRIISKHKGINKFSAWQLMENGMMNETDISKYLESSPYFNSMMRKRYI